MEKKNYDKKIVRNKGKEIGSILVYKKGLKRGMIFASFVTMSVLSFVVGRVSKKTMHPIIANTLTENYFEEPTYSDIPYIINEGDTLSDIVFSYEQDPNKAKLDIEMIAEYNNLRNVDHIIAGSRIYLVGVPASKLEDFGYTDNYNYFEPSVEVDLRLEFLGKVVDYVSNSKDYNEEFVLNYNNIKAQYENYKNDHIEGDEYKLDYIINFLRNLSEEAREYGFSFENNLTALPLSEAISYSAYKSY